MFIQWFVYQGFFFLFLKNKKCFRILAHPLICGIRFAEIQRACMKLLCHINTAIDITEDVQLHMNKCDNYVQYGTSAAVWECRRLLYTSVNLEIDIVLWTNEVINGRMWVIRLTYPPVQIWGLWLSRASFPITWIMTASGLRAMGPCSMWSLLLPIVCLWP